MPTLALLDAAAATAAALVIGQTLTLCAVLGLRLRDARSRQAAASARRQQLGQPVSSQTPAEVWLLVTIAAAAAQATGDLLNHLDLRFVAHALSPLTNPALLLVGPAMWFYAGAITRLPGEPAPTWRSFALHAAPALLLCAASATQVLSDPYHAPQPASERAGTELAVLGPVAVQILVYLIAVIRRVRGLRPRLEARFSNVEHRQLRWLEAGAWTFAALVVAWVATWAMPVAASNIITNLVLAADVGLLGVFGARQLNVFAPARRPPTPPDEEPIAPFQPLEPQSHAAPATPHAAPAAAASAKYAKSSLAPGLAEAIAARLEAAMRADQPYLENDLTLPDLAARVGSTPHQLSQVLSTHIGLSFFEYVNRLRIEAVKATLARPQASGRPLLEIALECGFGSKTAFNDAFKRATGMSPSAYRRGLPATAQSSVRTDDSAPA